MFRTGRFFSASVLSIFPLLAWSAASVAATLDIPGPAGSVAFGYSVAVLSNGNIAVADPYAPPADAGAVYLYTASGTLIATLRGNAANDRVGSDGIGNLDNGNFVVFSPHWTDGTSVGAVTWVNGSTGLSGAVTSSNSLTGVVVRDLVVLKNGNYVLNSPGWNGIGAVTWADGNSGLARSISTSNSLVGTGNGSHVFGLATGNYVVGNPQWNGNRGAVTWGNGTSGTFGDISAANSLVGTSDNDQVGGATIIELTNGDYVVGSPYWNGAKGAVTRANGAGGGTGLVSSANSLVGSVAGDRVGTVLVALSNGNFVVSSPYWNNGTGAATWCTGNTTGVVAAGNSLIGTSVNDGVGNQLTALTNGNYVVGSPYWQGGIGAATWGNGTTGSKGVVSALNSIVGSSPDDRVGYQIVALAQGNYVVASPYWNSNAGATTWGNGTLGTSGSVSDSNSLIGAEPGDYAGFSTALVNGNYVVNSPAWNGFRGAVTFGDGNTGIKGQVSAANSLVGTSPADDVGRNIIPLRNGNFVVDSYTWNNYLGAVTWSSGITGIRGVVSPDNSLVGTVVGDYVGRVLFSANPYWNGVTPLADGNYFVNSLYWHDSRGAVTLANGDGALIGTIETTNSVTGTVDGPWGMTIRYDLPRKRLVVGRPSDNLVSILVLVDEIFAGGFE